MDALSDAMVVPTIFAGLSGVSAFLRSASYQLAGMLIVVGTLGLLYIAVSLLSALLRATGRERVPVAGSVSPAPAEAVTLAAVAAAVAHVIRRPHRIVTIQADPGARQAWSAEGRRAIYQSHKVR